jgi:hypothetical protein
MGFIVWIAKIVAFFCLIVLLFRYAPEVTHALSWIGSLGVIPVLIICVVIIAIFGKRK